MVSAAVLGGLACGERPGPPPAGAAASTPAAPADSLVVTTPDGTELWFTFARADTGGGRSCTDRALEIRRGAKRMPVPLLYTAAVPELVNDSTARARLSTHCRPGAAYLVNLRTGRPVREGP
jgi:hypothetical protein